MQIESFLITVFCGVIIGFLFDGYRVLRGILNPQSFLTDVGDLIFWAVSTLVVFATLLMTNWGEVRLYVFIGLAIGLTVYIKLLSRPVTGVLIALWRFCGMVGRYLVKFLHTFVWQPSIWIIGLVALPFLWAYRNPCRYLINRSRTIGKRCKDMIIKNWFSPKDPPD
jgi:spore cortex biosynthesis protein YabQ